MTFRQIITILFFSLFLFICVLSLFLANVTYLKGSIDFLTWAALTVSSTVLAFIIAQAIKIEYEGGSA
ncbi:MAG: hypothetical protein ACXABY_30615 [Candidatus Thorarchaeota archaeon]